MVFFNGILIAMTFGDDTFRILDASDDEQLPKKAHDTGLGLGCGIGASTKIFSPLIMGATIGSNAVQQEVTLQAVFPASILFATLLFVSGILYPLTEEMKGASLEEI